MVSTTVRKTHKIVFVTLTQTGQEILMIADQRLVISVVELLLGVVRNNYVLPYQLQKQNTLLLPVQLKRQYG